MKLFISKTLLFLFFAFVFYVVLLFAWGLFVPSILKSNLNYPISSNGHNFSRLSEVKSYGDIDVLFLGSSHAYRGFDTRLFLENGYKSFNLGSSAQTPVQTKLLVDRYLEKLNPEMVIYEVFPATFALDGVESSLDIIANDLNDLNSIKMALKINNIKTYNTLIYAYICNFIGLNKFYTEPVIKGKDKYISGGYVEREISFNKPVKFKKNKISLRKDQLKSFSEIIHLIKSRNIKLFLVYAPIPSENYHSYTNNHYFDSIMKKYSEYYNYNELLLLNDSLHFYDSHHLNQKGVFVFNKKLIELLNKTNYNGK
jgi:hypothetical protein